MAWPSVRQVQFSADVGFLHIINKNHSHPQSQFAVARHLSIFRESIYNARAPHILDSLAILPGEFGLPVRF
jgi:hypothetical protein